LSQIAGQAGPKEEEMTKTLYQTIAHRFVAYRARRAQEIALGSLLSMDAARLDDLGICAQDIMDALQSPPPATPLLDARRAERAATWTVLNTAAAAA
jgi:hypothetical protein